MEKRSIRIRIRILIKCIRPMPDMGNTEIYENAKVYAHPGYMYMYIPMSGNGM